MKFVGLTGGIGSGKSTVGRHLGERGADVIDVDLISRELQQPGNPVFDQIVARWGTGILDAEGRLDREALGRIVFADTKQLGELTGMTGVAVGNEVARRASLHMGTDDVVVAEAAIYPAPMYGMAALLLVDVPIDLAVARLVEHRGMTEADARARATSQIPREHRLATAGFILENSGTPEELASQIDSVWDWIRELPDSTPTKQP